MRKAIKIKTISNEPIEFIPEDMRDLDKASTELESCPMIFIGKKPNRDQQWVMQDMLELKDPKNTEKGVKGMGEAFKYMWENIITEIKNVEVVGDSITGDVKNSLWENEDLAPYITEAITFYYTNGKLDEEEVKT